MSIRCSISGEVPQEPVVSQVSGNIFEKRLVIKFIEENGVDPINGEKLTKEQVIFRNFIDINIILKFFLANRSQT